MMQVLASLSAICFAFLWGGSSFCGSVIFATAGMALYRKIAGISFPMEYLPSFVWYVGVGAAGEMVHALSPLSGGLAFAWCIFPLSVGLSFFTKGIASARRKIMTILYLCLVMLLHIRAGAYAQSHTRLVSVEIAGLAMAFYSLIRHRKRKSDA